MSTIIQIKRSANVAAPTTSDLVEAELAYSQDASNNGAGAKLYIESVDSGSNPVIHAIGGKYYTDAIDNATSSATPNTLVKRDANGDITANVIYADHLHGNIVGTIDGVASSAVISNTANTLTTARNITLVGDVTGTVSFNGSQDVSITTTANINSVALGTDTTGDYVANVLAGSGIVITNQGGETATPTVALGTSGVTANTYGGASKIPVLTVDQYGRITSAANVAVAGVSTFAASGNTFTITTSDGGSYSASIQADSVRLGTDTTGAYVSNLVAGTGVTLTGLGNEGTTPTIAIGQSVATSADVTFNTVTTSSTANINGTTLTGGGSGFFVDPVAAGTTGNVVYFNASTKELTYGAPASSSFTIKGTSGTDTFNTGDTMFVVGGSGVATAVTDNTITITNLGVTGVSTGYGLSTSSANGSITLNNTGVTKLSTGSGLGVDATSGNVTITNLGVTAISGTANEIEVSAANASVQIGLPDNVTIGNDLTVTGNLVVNGVVTTINTSVITIEDPLVKFGNANPADSLDIGFFGEYTNSGTKWAGLFRDASDSGTFKLFKDLTTDPTTNVINTANYTVATLVSNLTGGTVSGLASAIAVSDGGSGANTFTTNGVLYGQGASAFAVATGSAGQVLQLNGSGVPTFGGIDGGTY